MIRFDLNLNTNTGVVDPTFTPISVPGDPASVGLNLGWNGNQLDVLVSSGRRSMPTTRRPARPWARSPRSEPVNSIGSTDTVTVLGSYATNQLQMINLTASLQTGVAQPAPGNPQAFTPDAGFTLLGGLTSLPARPRSSPLSARTFDTFTADSDQLGHQAIRHRQRSRDTARRCRTSSAAGTRIGRHPERRLCHRSDRIRPIATQPGAALGSIDQSLALVAGASNGTNHDQLSSGGTLTLNYPDLLTGLSEAFRPDLTSSALIDIQGDVQSIRGGSATGMVLNDNGNLNLVKFASVTNSTIVGQPVEPPPDPETLARHRFLLRRGPPAAATA